MATLVLQSGYYAGKHLSLPMGKTITFGRGPEAAVSFPDDKLSRLHCQFFSRDGLFFVKDLDSTNGTFINDKLVAGETELFDFDHVRIGDLEIEFHSANFSRGMQKRG